MTKIMFLYFLFATLSSSFALDDHDRELFSKAGTKECMEDFLQKARRHDNRIRRREVSMWLVEKSESTVDCVFWRLGPNDHKAYWHGPIPSGTVANVHSHPGNVEKGVSPTDMQSSLKTGLPFYAVESKGRWIYKAAPYGDNGRIGLKVGRGSLHDLFVEILQP